MPRQKKQSPLKTPKADVEWFRDRADTLDIQIGQLSRDLLNHKDLLNRALKGERELKAREIFALSVRLDVPLAVLFKALGYPVAPSQISSNVEAMPEHDPFWVLN